MELEAVIFDLDGTLLDTGALQAARDGKQWEVVKAHLDQVRPFAAEGIPVERAPAAIRALGLRVGIVTHSPRWYAEQLLGRFGIVVDGMITGSDRLPRKPDPGSLKQMAAELGVAVGAAAYVGDEATDMAAAAAAGMASIGVRWSKLPAEEWRRWWPDIAIARVDHLVAIESLDRRRPLAEAVLAGNEPIWHFGTLMRLAQRTLACGRYFPANDVARHGQPLSTLVLQAKDDKGAASRTAEIMARLGDRPSWRDNAPELIVSVPPRPEQDHDRFTGTRVTLAAVLGARNGGGILSMEFPVDDYKRMDHDTRRLINEGRFRSKPLNGEAVLLIDDVITSGSQAAGCRTALLEAGARSVTVLAFTATQDPLPEACPLCGAHLRMYHRRSDDRPFIGCSAFPRTGCQYLRDAGD